MTDLEGELREVLEEDARRAPAPHGARTAVHMTRRRQLATAGFGFLAVAVAAALAVGGIATLLPLRRDGVPLGEAGGTTRTASLPYLTITYPRDWLLTVWNDPMATAATIQLTSFDPDVRANPVCFSDNQSMPQDGVLLAIEVGNGPTGGEAPTWPQPLEPSRFGNPRPCGVDGDQLSASWAIQGGAISMTANALIAPAASEPDRTALFSSFRSLSFDADPYDMINVGSPQGAVVLSSGITEETPWVMTASPDATQPGIALGVDLGASPDGSVGGLRGSGIGGVVVASPDDTWVSSPVMAGNTMLFGAVSEQVARVEIRPDDAEPFDAELVDPPESLGANVRVFIAPMTGAPRGTVATYNVAGNLVAERTFTPDGYSSPKTERHDPSDGAIASGGALGEEWRLLDAGEEIRLVDVEKNEIGFASRDPEPYLSLAAYIFTGRDGDGAVLVFGVAGPEVTEVVLFTSGLPAPTQLAPLGDGLQAWWQLYSPGDLKGQVIALGRDCEVLQAINLATGEAPETVAATSCG